MAGAQTSEVDTALKSLQMEFPSIIAYVVLNADAIVVKHSDDMPYERAVMYGALVTDFLLNCRKCLRDLLADEPTSVRMRTKESTEIIVLMSGDNTLIAIQNCGKQTEGGEEKPAAGAGT
eukprot:GEMP01086306.1.p2 GENE.GEMP01086306.1~~GEMP01086306.1.p2  ORF type:complete len:120 (+),score=24.51 GEMP01086306.1:45-404(+)